MMTMGIMLFAVILMAAVLLVLFAVVMLWVCTKNPS